MSIISQTAEYALRSVVFLAQAEGEPRTTHEIARATGVQREYLSKVLQALRRCGLVSARPGSGGGFQLAQSPTEMTVQDVVVSVDPPSRITSCPLGLASHEAKLCRLHARLDSAMDAVETAFRNTKIDELVPDSPRQSDQCSFPIRPKSIR